MYEEFQVAVAILLERDGRILLGKRSGSQDFARGIWEFPAGRIEKGEKPEDAIEREAKEELGISINSKQLLDAYRFDRNGVVMLLLTYICQSNDDITRSEEHQELRWVKPREAMELFSFGRQKKTIQLYLQSR